MALFSGILLVCVVLGITGFLINEAAGDKVGAWLRRYKQSSSTEPQDSLVGHVGRVIANDDDAEFTKVRVGMERWNARSDGGEKLAVGDEVEVIGMSGLVLDVKVHVSE